MCVKNVPFSTYYNVNHVLYYLSYPIYLGEKRTGKYAGCMCGVYRDRMKGACLSLVREFSSIPFQVIYRAVVYSFNLLSSV